MTKISPRRLRALLSFSIVLGLAGLTTEAPARVLRTIPSLVASGLTGLDFIASVAADPDPTPAAPTAPAPTPAPSTAAETKPVAESAPAPVPFEPAKPVTPEPAPTPEAVEPSTPPSESAKPTPADAPVEKPAPIEKSKAKAKAKTKPDADADADKGIQWTDRDDIVQFVGSVTVGANERAHDVVVFGGNAKIDGQVVNDLVVFGGGVELNGRVRGEIVIFGGNLKLGPEARVGSEVVVIGGGIDNPHGRPIPRREVIGGFDIGQLDNNPGVKWLQRALFQGRLLAPSVGWPWIVFFGIAVFYLLITALFPRGVAACIESVEERPAGTLLTAFLMLFVLPVLVVVLTATVVGILLLPFLFLALVFAGIFGKASLISFLGRSLLRAFGLTEAASFVLAGLGVGLALVALLYCVPVLGVLTWALTSWYGLGVALFTMIKRMRREKPNGGRPAGPGSSSSPSSPGGARRPISSPDFGASPGATSVPVMAASVAPAAYVASESPAPEAAGAASAKVVAEAEVAAAAASPTSTPLDASRAGSTSAGFVGTPADAGAAAVPPQFVGTPPPFASTAGTVPPVMPGNPLGTSAGTLLVNSTSPRAEFWARLGAFVLDVVLIAIVSGVIGFDGAFPFFFGAYSFALWLWRGTTVGGVVFSLKLVRLDDRPVDPATVLVRVLVGYLSLIAAGLGFLWCAWDPEQQTWHDKVAGTIVVRAPKGMSLV